MKITPQKQEIIFAIVILTVASVLFLYILYKHHLSSKPIYYDAPIDNENPENFYDGISSQEILKSLDEDSLNVEEKRTPDE